MKIGQTSLVMFISKLLGSALGFVATLYFSRKLGAEVIGLYTLVLTVTGWLILVGEVGIGKAMTKRISEAKEPGAYLAAAFVWFLSLTVFLSVIILTTQPLLESYVTEFDQYAALSVVWFVVAILLMRFAYFLVFHTLKGERKVHIVGLLNPVELGSQSLLQIGFVVVGYGLLGMLVGYILGGILVSLIGLYWVEVRPTIPKKRHFRSLFDYAKFSWLGSLRAKAFNEVDILLLGVFVQPSLVGIYSVAWSIAKFLELFGSAISTTMFPEISHTSSQETKTAVTGLVEDSLTFTGLIVIPGFVGGAILAERLLRLYGPEFVEGATVLSLLILATLLYSYQRQLLNGINGIDRPDLAFRVNAIFIPLNAGLNIVLIPSFGIEGAAVASIVSIAFSLVFAYRVLDQLIEFDTPLGEIARQVAAALFMGAVILGTLEAIETTEIIKNNLAIILLLVMGGAGLYFLVLFLISPQFRTTVNRNLPVTLSYFNRT